MIHKLYRATLAAGLLTVALAAQAQNPVTFQIDMTSQPSATSVFIRGTFNGWGTDQLNNNGSGVYTGVVNIADSPGTVEQCKFFYQPGDNWESVANRQFLLAGGAQTLPLTSWNVSDWPAPVNPVTFQIDMSAQIQLGKFTNGNGFVRVSGGFNGWGASADFTNNPSASGSASNIYRQTLGISGYPGSSPGDYKFRSPIGDTWETINNRPSFQLVGNAQTLPLVFWDDASTCDLLQFDTTVTFVLHMTNGTVSTDGHVFDKTVDELHINGAFLGWWAWYDGIGGGNTVANQLTNNPIGSDLYQQTFTIAKGSPLATHFKYSVNGYDNEAPFGSDHIAYVRTPGSTYVFPTSEFGTNYAALRVEQSFGNLTITPAAGGNNKVSWLGRQCVTLQSKTNINGTWVDMPATDGASSTNLSHAATSQFYRLQKRQGL